MTENDDLIQIANEFTCIHVRKIQTKNGELLEIESKKNDGKITLDAMQLESLTVLKPEHFSKFFEIHFGLDDTFSKKSK
ncbi:hypothetical protein [Neobacillus vireti]|uniref:Uncharacterized protein n=1 Tax=Neobacillus vireti LMG 21834 TaxID=1131730 RepID=A0AB94ITU7_9BACI|nr:hypothetical protein [Neobacillus vireti]ETI70500.1 hypothetical protein BAVI_02089 [Neobacillus vireti LMG 21834]